MTLKHPADGPDQICPHVSLRNITVRTSTKGSNNVSTLLMYRQENYFGSMISAPYTYRGLKSIEDRHRHIDHEDVRVKTANRVNRLFSILHGADNFKLLAKFRAKP